MNVVYTAAFAAIRDHRRIIIYNIIESIMLKLNQA